MSIKAIAKNLGVSRGTVSLWCEDIELTEEQRKKLIGDDKRGGAIGRSRAAISIKNERLNRVEKYMREGRLLVGDLSERDLLIAGIALYWAEGSKKGRETKFINSDPLMIKIWLKWLEQFADVQLEDLIFRIGINQIHESRISDVIQFWTNVVGVGENQFRKTSYKKVLNHKIYSNFESHYGTLMVTVRKGTNLNYEILGMIEALGLF
jgi:hypothetical protein